MIKISDIKISPLKHKDHLVGFASFIIENCMFVSSIGIYTRPEGGYRLSYPIRNNTRDKLNYFFPINKKVGEFIEHAVIAKYQQLLEENK